MNVILVGDGIGLTIIYTNKRTVRFKSERGHGSFWSDTMYETTSIIMISFINSRLLQRYGLYNVSL
jgi:hypothetical protein